MIVVGIAGGVASGKSFVSEQLEILGARILDADRVAHEVLLETDVKNSIRRRWGDSVFDNQGEVNRKEVAKIVFSKSPQGAEDLKYLEGLTHPRIGQRLRKQMDEFASDKKTKVVVLDAAVMFKAGWDRFCDKIIFVDAPRDVRLARAKSRGWSEMNFVAREAAQETLDVKKNHADFVVDNSKSIDETFAQIQEFWNRYAESSF